MSPLDISVWALRAMIVVLVAVLIVVTAGGVIR